MKIAFRSIITVFVLAAYLVSPMSSLDHAVLAKAEDGVVQQQDGFRWKAVVTPKDDGSNAPAQALPAYRASGVGVAAITGGQLVLEGQDSLAQLRSAMFDTASPYWDFLGGPVELVVHMPAEAKPVTLRLQARIAAGYRWVVNAAPGALYTESAPADFSVLYAGYGAPAIQTIRLQGSGSGEATVRLQYKRAFGPSEAVVTHLNVWMSTASDLELSDPTPVAPLQDAQTVQASSQEPSALAELLPKSVPSSWDWRTKGIVTPIRDQGGCGSCWAFATVGAMEAALLKSGGPAADLSEQFLVSCNKEGWSCSGGWQLHDYHTNVLGKNQTQAGAVLESDMPYTATNGSCKVSLNHPYKLSGWGYVGGLNAGNYWYSIPTYEQLKNAIYTYGPITVGVCVGNAFQNYRGGLFATDESSACAGGPNHLIVLVGWNDADQSLILRNSWNTWWGENGYMNIKYGTSMIGIAPTWVTRVAVKPAPALSKPIGNIHGNKPKYVWSRVGASTSYKLQVYDIAAASYKVNITVSSSYCSATTKLCTYTPSTLLTYGRNYKWRAAATGGTWSAWKAFNPTIR
jgi:C1A family cysteine protease/predicted secreted protein